MVYAPWRHTSRVQSLAVSTVCVMKALVVALLCTTLVGSAEGVGIFMSEYHTVGNARTPEGFAMNARFRLETPPSSDVYANLTSDDYTFSNNLCTWTAASWTAVCARVLTAVDDGLSVAERESSFTLEVLSTTDDSYYSALEPMTYYSTILDSTAGVKLCPECVAAVTH